MKRKINWVQLIRHLVQVLGLIVLPGAFIMLFNSFKSVYQALLSGSFTLAGQGSALVWIGIVIPATMVWGRFFCGWLCAFGAMQELLAFIARKLKIPQLRINEDLDEMLRRMKYVVLGALVIIWTLKISIDAFSPWFVFGQYSSISGSTTFSHLLTFGGVLLFLIIIGSLFSERVFCKYLCPLGGILHISSKLRLFKIKKRRRLCVDCTHCSKACPMEIEVDQETSDAKSDAFSECINCFRCSASCPKAALYYNSREALAGTMAALTMTGVFYGGNLLTSKAQASSQTASVQTSPVLEETVAQLPSGVTQTESQKANGSSDSKSASDSQVSSDNQKPIETSSATEETIEETVPQGQTASQGETASQERYADGTYYGSGSGFRGSIEVSVTVESGLITDITIESYKDDRQFFSQAKDSVINAILSAQTADVSAVSGATYSSRGIMEAVADALDQSWMEKAAETTLEAEETEESEEESEEDLTWEEESEESEEEEFSEEDEEEEESEEPEEFSEEEEDEEGSEEEENSEDSEMEKESFAEEEEPETVGESTGYFADGYYQGSGSGRNGAIVVSVTVEGGYITSIDVESSSEDSPYFSRAVYVIDEVLSAQSVDVATVSGATMSSNGILEAVANALGLDFTNTNSQIGGHGRR
ncbi:MAG: FMN-binding protein [Firmicutes bacterium]|nr:FMN-binding protein [Bacillota bacterium]